MPARSLPLPAAIRYTALLCLATIWIPAALLAGWAYEWQAKWMLILGVVEMAAAAEVVNLALHARRVDRVTVRRRAR